MSNAPDGSAPGSVGILGGFQTDFARNLAKEGRDVAELFAEVIEGTLADAGIGAQAIQSIHVGNAFGQLYNGQGHLGAMPATVVPELWGVPAVRHEAACASASMAVLAAMAEIEAGRYDCVLVVGAEQEKNVPSAQGAAVQAAAAWVGHETEGIDYFWPYAFDRIAEEYDKRFGIDDEHLRAIGELNLRNARSNPNAQTRNWKLSSDSFAADDRANPVVSGRLRRNDVTQLTDGAAGLVLVSPRMAAELAGKRTAAGITGKGGGSGSGNGSSGDRASGDTRPGDRASGDTRQGSGASGDTRQGSGASGDTRPGSGASAGGASGTSRTGASGAKASGAPAVRARITGWGHRTVGLDIDSKLKRSAEDPYVMPHVRQAILDALGRAGIEGVDSLDVIETHDCMTPSEYMAIDHFGITGPGESWQAIEDGSLERSGRIPVNPSGGLIGGGHPVGATGARMLVDAMRQVSDSAGDYQIEGATRAATLNIGGSTATTACFVVESAEHS